METDDLIDGYLRGTLSDAELRSVEARLMQDPAWAKSVSEYAELTEQVECYAWQGWERRLLEIEQKLDAKGFFFTDEDLEWYLAGMLPDELHRRIENLLMRDAAFLERVEQMSDIYKASMYAGYTEWEDRADALEKRLERAGFFDEVDKPLLEKQPDEGLHPAVRALIAVGALVAALFLLRWIILRF